MGGSKGLTLDTVIVMGVEKGLIPLPPPKGKLNEERRLLYVAITRAEQLCLMTFARERSGQLAFGGDPNPYGTRGRTPLVEGLPGYGWIAGDSFVQKYLADAKPPADDAV